MTNNKAVLVAVDAGSGNVTIAYEEKIETYHIQDNHLILLDKEKDLNPDYTLSRQ